MLLAKSLLLCVQMDLRGDTYPAEAAAPARGIEMQNSTAPLAVAVGRALPTSREKRAGPQPGSRQKKRKGRRADPGARKGAASGKPPAAPLTPLYMDEKDPLTGCPRWCKTPEQQRQWLISQHNHTSREELLAMRDSWPGSCIIRASPAAPPVVVPGTPVSALAPPFIPQHLVPDVRQNVAVPMDAAPVVEGPAHAQADSIRKPPCL